MGHNRTLLKSELEKIILNIIVYLFYGIQGLATMDCPNDLVKTHVGGDTIADGGLMCLVLDQIFLS